MQQNNAWLWLFGAAAVVIILAGLRSISHIITPFLLAAFLAVICIPPLTWMREKGLPAVVAPLVLFVGVGVSFFLLFMAIRHAVEELALQAPLYQDRLTALVTGLQELAEKRGVPQELIPQEIMIDTATITEVARMLARGVGQFTTYLFFVLLAFMFILLEARTFPGKLKAAFPKKRRAQVRTRRFLRSLNRYLAVKTVASILTGLFIGVGLTILNVDFAILWGIVAGLLNFVPTIGSIIAAVPAVLIALLGMDLADTVLVIIVYLIPNIIIGSILEPRFMGQTLGLSPVVVLISLLVWGWVFGPVGMLLSILLTMIVKLGLESSSQTQWLGILLSDKAKRN